MLTKGNVKYSARLITLYHFIKLKMRLHKIIYRAIAFVFPAKGCGINPTQKGFAKRP